MKITVTQEEIDALLDAAETQEHLFWGGKEMFVSYKLPSGFTVTGRAGMISPKYFDAAVGRKYCREDASNQLWQLEGYRKQLELTKNDRMMSEGFQQLSAPNEQKRGVSSLEPALAVPNNTQPSKQTPSQSFILNTYKYFVDLPHQHKAIAFLAQHLPTEVAIEFERLWRDDPGNQKPVTSAMVVPTVAKVAEEKPKRLVDKIVAYMKMKGYQIYTVNGKVNIVYVEGMNPDGTLNDDTPNWFNDVRIVFEYRGDKPEILGIWEATTEPGYFYTQNPMNPDGCARIQFGQYHAWQVGYHGVADPHEALVQYDNVTLCRDLNQDYSRIGDKLYTGYDFGINQHWGGDSPVDSIGRWSAGCLVGRTRDGHRAFMKIVKQDRDYVKNKSYVFSTTIIPGDDLMKKFP
jgi:hypothetical protein